MALLEPDTIAAISTPLGEGGIGIVRLSGPRALPVGLALFRRADGSALPPPAAQTAHYGRVYNPLNGETIDECVLTWFHAPHSYTAEDVVELACHGSNLVLRRVLEAALREGARLAEPGEFTQRAFLNGRLDLARAEAVIDVIRARTDVALRVATQQMEGQLSQEIRTIRETLIGLLAEIEAAIDFPDDVEPLATEGLIARAEAARAEALLLLRHAEAGRLYREGAAVVIAGRPNVGKSSLLNALLRESRAIVTEIPGTTRDVIEESLHLRGLPLRAIDTAGLRATAHPVERIGVRRTRAEVEAADLILFTVDASVGLTPEDSVLLAELAGRRMIVVGNKIDLGDRLDAAALPVGTPVVPLSALTGANLAALEAAIYDSLIGAETSAAEILVSNTRHRRQLEEAAAAIERAVEAAKAGFEQAVVAVDLKIAAEALGEITGETVTEATISQIFARFCVGK
ncbi:MAG: tRNA uridine-5-carboxymethylaminomethyl(34) synthesis GTPase MnmE [Armatimonadetes bacterium]|nr:tRNA uridine-5-carboxymethylaminomethyl(34) synthesis GTPase MnmE [Armatimonadota bacterium]